MVRQSTKKELLDYSESIVNTVREPLIVLDQNLRVVTASRFFYKSFKTTAKDTEGQLIYELGNNQWDIPKLRELLETILPKKTSFDDYEVEHKFAGIGQRTMLLNARQIEQVKGKKRVILILLAIEDITARRATENGLMKAYKEMSVLTNELERAAQAKSEFLANMSHELRTPLNSINGFSEVLYDETFGPLNEKQKQYINNVLSSGKHLLLLINEILDTVKIEAGKMTLTISSLSMNDVLADVVDLFEGIIQKKKLLIQLELTDDVLNIEADEVKIKQILFNLLSNAVHFTLEGGEIGICARQHGSYIEVVVRDTGIGIAAEYMEKIFEGFFRIDTPYSRLTEGTGLGLSIAKSLVELHGGTLIAESEGVNKGTSIRFTLPTTSNQKGAI